MSGQNLMVDVLSNDYCRVTLLLSLPSLFVFFILTIATRSVTMKSPIVQANYPPETVLSKIKTSEAKA
jgi:hypothetical protein